MIGPKGDVLYKYDKIHLYDVNLPNGDVYRESDTYKSGNKAIIAEIKKDKIKDRQVNWNKVDTERKGFFKIDILSKDKFIAKYYNVYNNQKLENINFENNTYIIRGKKNYVSKPRKFKTSLRKNTLILPLLE